MTFDVVGLLIFLLAIFPGVIAQQARHSIVPRSVQPKSTIEETGEYLLNSVFTHIMLLALFECGLALWWPVVLTDLEDAIEGSHLSSWGWQYRDLLLAYFVLSLAAGFALGIVRGILVLNQPVRNRLINVALFRRLLQRLGIFSFLQEEPVWYDVFRQRYPDELVFVQALMKADRDVYTGELRSYGILGDSDRQKDFLLVNVFHRRADQQQFVPIQTDGVLLNFADVEVIQVRKTRFPRA